MDSSYQDTTNLEKSVIVGLSDPNCLVEERNDPHFVFLDIEQARNIDNYPKYTSEVRIWLTTPNAYRPEILKVVRENFGIHGVIVRDIQTLRNNLAEDLRGFLERERAEEVERPANVTAKKPVASVPDTTPVRVLVPAGGTSLVAYINKYANIHTNMDTEVPRLLRMARQNGFPNAQEATVRTYLYQRRQVAGVTELQAKPQPPSSAKAVTTQITRTIALIKNTISALALLELQIQGVLGEVEKIEDGELNTVSAELRQLETTLVEINRAMKQTAS